MTLRYLLITTATALIAVAQQPTPAEPADPKKLATIEGSIFNAQTGEALKKVNLSLRPAMTQGMGGNMMMQMPSVYAAATDAQGKFKIERIDPGAYTLTAERQGFVRKSYNPQPGSQAGATLTLTAGQHMKELNLKLAPHAVITGHIFDEDGEPVMRARIQVMRYMRNRGRKQLAPVGNTESNDLGEYRIHSIPPGRYYVSAVPPNRGVMFGEPAAKNAAAEEYITTYFPASTSEADARQIELASGQSLAGVDIRVKKSPVFHIRGKIPAAAGTPRGLRVQAVPRGQGFGFMFGGGGGMVLADGSFDLASVPPGSYDVMVMPMGGPMPRSFARVAVEVTREDISGITLNSVETQSIKGKLIIDGDIQALEQKLGRKASLSGARVQLISMEGISFNAPNTPVAEDGTFSLENTSAEVYRVSVFGLPQGLWLKAVNVGGQDVLDKGLDLTAGALAPLELILGVGTATISGTVQDSKQQPMPGVTVTLFIEPYKEDRMESFRTASSDQNGNFKLMNVTPGTYKVYAWEAFDPTTQTDPEVLKKYETDGKLVQLKPNGEETLSLKALP